MTTREADDITVIADERRAGRAVVSVIHGNFTTSLRVSDGELRRIRDAINTHLSDPPTADVREALEMLDTLNEHGLIQYDDYREMHDLVSAIQAQSVRPYGTVTDTEVLRAKASALTEFADAVRMPFTIFRGGDGAPVTPGDLMRETAARYLAEADEIEARS